MNKYDIIRCSNERLHKKKMSNVVTKTDVCGHFLGAIPVGFNFRDTVMYCSSCNQSWSISRNDYEVVMKRLPKGIRFEDNISSIKVVENE